MLGAGVALQDSDRLDSDFLNPMPSDLAAQLEAHKNPEGELVSVPSDLARQIEEHKKETKVRWHDFDLTLLQTTNLALDRCRQLPNGGFECWAIPHLVVSLHTICNDFS